MLKENQFVDVKWGTKNREWFNSKGYEFTKFGELFKVKAEDLMRTTKTKITLVCDICRENEFETTFYNYSKTLSGEYHCDDCKSLRNKITAKCPSCDTWFASTKTALNKSKSGYLFCSNECVGLYNGQQRDRKKEKICTVCNTLYSVKRVHFEKSVACSNECQAKWQSMNLVGENANNFKGGDRVKVCEMCHEDYTCNSPYQVTHRRFCGVTCKENYWIANTLTSDTFIENRYEGNRIYRASSQKETKPERMVREWLESQGEYFKQEQGFFRKYFADFYFPLERAVIEVMGDYWHANPEVYGEGKTPLNEMQSFQVKKDINRKKDFERYNFIYVEVWEKDIYENLEETMKNAMLKIYPRNDYTQDILTPTVKDEDIV